MHLFFLRVDFFVVGTVHICMERVFLNIFRKENVHFFENKKE